MLEVRDLECVRGQRQLFRDLSFSIRPGECLELRGTNGSGKTSLLRMLSGMVAPTSGAILWHGTPIDAVREAYLASLAYVGHRCAVKDELTAIENLRLSCALSGCGLSEEVVRDVLHRMALNEQAHLHTRQLSDGQRRRLALARLLACPRSMWLLDEVLTSLDEVAARSMTLLVDEHLSSGGMAVIATHQDLRLAARMSRRIELAA
jgi:heme exporter protein A